MGTHGEIHNDNVIKATMEELTEEECKAYLNAEEHLKEQFLQCLTGRGDRWDRCWRSDRSA